MPILLLAAVLAPAVLPSNPVELNPHLKAVYARQDGVDTGEFIELRDMFPGSSGPLVVAIDGNGTLAGFWDFSQITVQDWLFLAGGPSVANRHGDLASGIGPAISGTSDFFPNGTVTISAFHANAAYAAYLTTLVGLDVDPDGDGATLLEDAQAPYHQSYGTVALVDGTWPESSRVFDCAPIVGPDGQDSPAGAVVSSFPRGPCLDQFLLADGSNVNPGLSNLHPCFDGHSEGVSCGEALVGTPFCEGTATPFPSRTLAWGSPLFADQNLHLGTFGGSGWIIHLGACRE